MTAEPLTPEEEAALRADIAEGPEGRAEQVYGEDVLRLLATLDAARATHTPSAGEGLDVDRLARALDAPGVFDAPVDDAIGLAEDIAREYAALHGSEAKP